MTSRLIAIVTSVGVKPVTCRHCRTPILLAMRASERGRPAKWLPFDRPRPWALSTDRNDETGLVIEQWPAERLHFVTCTSKPTTKKNQGSRGRSLTPSRRQDLRGHLGGGSQ